MAEADRKNNGRNRRRNMDVDPLPYGCSQPSLCVAYIILSGASGWALKSNPGSSSYALGTFSFLLGHSLIGFLHTTHPKPAQIVTTIFRRTSILAEIAPLALINAELYFLNGFAREYTFAHLASAFVPLLAQTAIKEYITEVVDIALLANLGSLIYLQLLKETGVWTGGLIALTALNHFLFKKLSSRYNVPKIEIITVGLSFFTVFSLNSLKDVNS